jgi:AcrR family transcriptional regulator
VASEHLRKDKDTIRARILREASVLFAGSGYDRTTTQQIATAAGIEQSTLFHLFASKAAIMNTLLKSDLDAAVAAAERQLKRTGSPARRLYDYVVEDIGMVRRSPYSIGGIDVPRLLRELDFAGARARSQRLNDARVALIREGIGASEFVEVDPEAANRAIEWTIEGSFTETGLGRVADPDAHAHEVAGFCLRALLVDPDTLVTVRRDSQIPAEEDDGS